MGEEGVEWVEVEVLERGMGEGEWVYERVET